MATYRCYIACLVLGAASLASAGEAPLAEAAERADWDRVEILLKQKADANATQPDGMTALHWAAWHEHVDAASALIAAGADVNARNNYGVSPLSVACIHGNARLVRQLLKSGADANTPLPGNETPLMFAARSGNPDAVKALIEYGADVNARQRDGQTATMWAAAEGHADVIRLLIAAGADYRTPLKSGFTPLTFAVREGRLDAVNVLLAAGADVNEPMRPQIKGQRIARSGTSPLMLAVENGHFELAVGLLEAGADANDQRSGFTPLHAISWVRKPNRGDGVDGDPPPTGSGNITSLQMVRKLVEYGADVNARLTKGRSGVGRLNYTGATPLLLAADTADVPLMQLLVDLGADASIPNADNCPPLLAAAGIGTLAPGEEAGTEEEAIAAVRLLLKLGADINAVDSNGETAMHGAAYKSLPKMVEFLAAHGADINVWNRPNKYGWTPLDIARGYRPGNFKPDLATIEAIERVMRSAGIEPPPPPRHRPTRTWSEMPASKKESRPQR